MQTILNFLLRLVLLAAGLVFAASLAVVFVFLLLLAGLRVGWARLTGRPTAPFVFRVDPRAGFGRVYRAGRGTASPQHEPVRPARRDIGDVTDVQPKPPHG
jgi:hypothetical protein